MIWSARAMTFPLGLVRTALRAMKRRSFFDHHVITFQNPLSFPSLASRMTSSLFMSIASSGFIIYVLRRKVITGRQSYQNWGLSPIIEGDDVPQGATLDVGAFFVGQFLLILASEL
jgi:hypothetical protein